MPTDRENAAAADPGASPSSGGLLVARISAMMFLQYWPLGLWGVTISTLIAANTGEAGDGMFSPGFLGYAAAAAAIGSLLAPIVAGWIADHFFAAERVLSALHVACAASLYAMHECGGQAAFYTALLVYWQAFGPTVSLTNTIALRQLRDPQGEFAAVRVFGTVAWISAGVFVGVVAAWWWGESIEPTRVPLALAGFSHLAMSAYSLTLPSTRPRPRAKRHEERPPSAWRLLRPLAPFFAISVVAAALSQPYNVTNLFLNNRGYAGAAATLTVGQLTELVCLAVLPWLIKRFGLMRLFVVGVAAWAVRYALLGVSYLAGDGSLAGIALLGALLVHGPAYGFVYLVGAMYVAQQVGDESQGAAQGLHTVATGGVGHLVGGASIAWAQARWLTPAGIEPPPYRWDAFWFAFAVVGAALAITALTLLRPAIDERSEKQLEGGDDAPMNGHAQSESL